MSRDQLKAVKTRVDLVHVVRSSGLPLKRVGKNWMGRCPFHDDQDASLSVNPETQLWNCFGCDAGGDVVSFLQAFHKLDFREARERLEELVGSVPAPPAQSVTPGELPAGLRRPELLERVVEHYHRTLLADRQAQEYLRSRGLEEARLWQAFRLGYADGSLLELLPPSGELREALEVLGVVNRSGKEHLRGCVVVPLSHPDEGLVSLYGRTVGSARGRARHLYLPGPQRGVLNWQALKSDSQVVLAESVLDALSLYQAGVRNVTCTYGVSRLHEDLEALLGRFGVCEVTFCFDGDEAGRQGCEKLAPALRKRGMVCFAVELGDDRDPNQVLVEEGPGRLKALCLERCPMEPEEGEVPAGDLDQALLEKTGDGFCLCFPNRGLQYRVMPRPPFTGRLKVALRVTRNGPPYVDSLDLYTHRSRTAVINQLERRLELSREVLESHFLRILEEAERWAEGLRRTSEEPQTAGPPELTSEERHEALDFLKRPNLTELVLKDMEDLGYVGEDRGKLLAYLVGVSRLLPHPMAAVVISQSGAGKSGLTELVEQLTPPEAVVLYSRISPQALYYMGDDFLKGKLLILEERAGGEAADYSIRVLQSRQKLSQAVVIKDPVTGKMQTQHFAVEGPVAYLETTTDPRLNFENATRCFEIHLDESEEQTRRIQERQRQARTFDRIDRSQRNELLRCRHHNAQRLLEPVRVVIPYVEHLRFPSRWLRTRRDNERFLCLIEAVTFLHQFQRKRGILKGPEGLTPYIEATVADYRLAYQLAREVLGTTLHELSRSAHELWVLLRRALLKMAEGGDPRDIQFTRRDLRKETRWLDHRLREALQELVEMEYLEVVSGGSQGRTYVYRLLALSESEGGFMGELTTPDELAEGLEKERRRSA